MKRYISLLVLLSLICGVHAQKRNLILVEPESFTDKGGWVVIDFAVI